MYYYTTTELLTSSSDANCRIEDRESESVINLNPFSSLLLLDPNNLFDRYMGLARWYKLFGIRNGGNIST